MGFFTQGRYAAISSTAALVIALGGTSYAAVMVTGGDIKNNTVTTKDIKDKSLKLKDFGPGAKSGLKGATGPAGATGPQGSTGATGATGPIGPSQIFHAHNAGTTGVFNLPKTVISLTLPPGDYVVFTKVNAAPIPNASLWNQECTLGNPNGPGDYAIVEDRDYGKQTISNQIAFTIPFSVTVNLICDGINTVISEKRMTAIRAGSVAITPYPNVP